jgi:Xaa-Pro aminopeptidase
MEEAGKIHEDILINGIPEVLKEGMSEAELAAELFKLFIEFGSQGISRFYSFQTEMFPGQVCFGDSSIYPSYFDGPGSMIGMSPAIPIIGSRDRLLKKGDLIYIDVGCCIDGYNTDKTQIYIFKGHPSEEIAAAHRKCKEILDEASDLLRPLNVVSDIYNSVIGNIEQPFLDNFMGFGQRIAKFLGHGVGLHVDEFPVITNKINIPLKENMVIALEPKKGIAGIGMVGVEETFIVTPNGGKCITGGAKDIIEV